MTASPDLETPVAEADPTETTVGARCKGLDQTIHFAETKAGIDYAIRVCQACPVLDACKAYAREHREPFGVWGGESAAERRSFLRAAGRRIRVAA